MTRNGKIFLRDVAPVFYVRSTVDTRANVGPQSSPNFTHFLHDGGLAVFGLLRIPAQCLVRHWRPILRQSTELFVSHTFHVKVDLGA